MGFAGICNAAFDDFDNEEDDRRAGSPGIVSWQSHHDMAAANGEQLNGGINPR